MNSEHLPDDISLFAGEAELLPRVEPLWEELRRHHAELRPQWKEALLKGAFSQRKNELLDKSSGILVQIASLNSQDIAYCISTIAADGTGEVDSLFVRESHRRRGIGDALMSRSLAWFESRGIRSLVVDVMGGNEDAQQFYARYGFVERNVKMIKT